MDNKLKEIVPSQLYDLLERGNIATVADILLNSEYDIMNKTNLNNEDVILIKDLAIDCMEHLQFTNGVDNLNSVKDNVLSRPQTLDNTLESVLLEGSINEIYAPSGCGKSQVALQLIVASNQGSVFICTEEQFPVKRLKQLYNGRCDTKERPFEIFAKNIYVEHAFDVDDLKMCVGVKLPRLLATVPGIKVIVIDSIASPFRGTYTNYVQRAKDLREIVYGLLKLARQYKLTILCTNEVTDSFSDDSTSETIPTLGLSWSNLVTTRLKLSRLDRHITLPGAENNCQVRRLEIVFSPCFPSVSIDFVITEAGLIDV